MCKQCREGGLSEYCNDKAEATVNPVDWVRCQARLVGVDMRECRECEYKERVMSSHADIIASAKKKLVAYRAALIDACGGDKKVAAEIANKHFERLDT